MPQPHSLLVVDDEPDVIKSVKGLLRLDYRVLGATSAAAAVDVMRHEPVDAVLSDQRMEGMSGVELLQKLRADHPDCTRLLFTGYADLRAVIDAVNQGNIYRYITKPWNPAEFENVIRDACAYHDLIVERKQLLAEVQQKNRELTQANDLKTAFIQVAGHELRTPLAILMGFSKLALAEPSPPGPLNEYLAGMDKATTRLDRLVSQILKMLSVERFERILNRQPHELAPLLRRAAGDVMAFIRLRNQTLETDIPDELGTMSLDGEKVRDSVNQLMLNAIKFTPDGGCISLSARRSGDGARISVRDTGAGMDSQTLARLFEPFFTGLDVSRHSSGDYEHRKRGLGLGLSIVKAFTEMQGGQVTVSSEVGKGSTFTLLLPNDPAPAA